MSDQEFWAGVASLLELIGQAHGGSPASLVGGLADYVLKEAEYRDPDLAAAARRRQELVKAASARLPLTFEALFEPLPFTHARGGRRAAAADHQLQSAGRGPRRPGPPVKWPSTRSPTPAGISA